MIKRLCGILWLTLIIVSCSTIQQSTQEEAIQKTINSIVEMELNSTPSLLPPTAEKTQTPTATLPASPTKTSTPLTSPTKTTNSSANFPIEGYGPYLFPPNINPLTGLPVPDITNLDRRPISVKVSNYPRGIRPQWGLSFADNVFEYYHEAGLTRFNAIFYSQDAPQIGPIRSGRFSDEDIVEMYKAFFAFASSDFRVRKVLYNSSFSDRLTSLTDYPCPPTTKYPLCRVERETWNHLVTKTDKLYEHFDEKGIQNSRQNLDGFVFNQEIPPNGSTGDYIIVRFSHSSYHQWEFDPISGGYFRFQDSILANQDQEVFDPMVDRINGLPITSANVFVLLADYHYFSVDPEMVFIDFNLGGTGFGFRDGFAYPISWVRSAESDFINISNLDGNSFSMKPGNSWFIIIGSSSLVEEEPIWNFTFKTP
jgi:hypothetical protein